MTDNLAIPKGTLARLNNLRRPGHTMRQCAIHAANERAWLLAAPAKSMKPLMPHMTKHQELASLLNNSGGTPAPAVDFGNSLECTHCFVRRSC